MKFCRQIVNNLFIPKIKYGLYENISKTLRIKYTRKETRNFHTAETGKHPNGNKEYTVSGQDLRTNYTFPAVHARKSSPLNNLVTLNPEVEAALAEGKPVVALESAIITHGMPAPDNLATATDLEDILREKDCVPATVAVVRGKVVIGLSLSQLLSIADPRTQKIKISTRDIPHAIAMGLITGGTTVSATLVACRLAGINLFVTGGIGGVHRCVPCNGQASSTWDVSADLVELGRCGSIGVICSGVKSILDVPATLEYLETQGVSTTVLNPSLPASTAAADVRFPDFFTCDSGVSAPSFIRQPLDAARMIHAARGLQLPAGLLFAVPIPAEHQIMGEEIKTAITTALAEAHTSGVRGRDVTPFVLTRVSQLTRGKSQTANAALVRHNAQVGAAVATELARLGATRGPGSSDAVVHPLLQHGATSDTGTTMREEKPLQTDHNHHPVGAA